MGTRVGILNPENPFVSPRTERSDDPGSRAAGPDFQSMAGSVVGEGFKPSPTK